MKEKIVYFSLIIFLLFPFSYVSAVSTVTGYLQTGEIEKKKNGRGYLFQNEEPETKVLGLSRFFDGALLRGSDKKIFIIDGDTRRYVSNLFELQKYEGQEIFDVENDILMDYPLKIFNNGDLVRGSDMRIFLIQGNTKKHILNLEELRRDYTGQEILNVDDDLVGALVNV